MAIEIKPNLKLGKWNFSVQCKILQSSFEINGKKLNVHFRAEKKFKDEMKQSENSEF